MTDANKALVHHWFDRVWNHGNEAAIDELLAPNVRTHGFAGPDSVTIGRDAFKEGHRRFHSAFSNIHVKVHHVIAEGNHVSAHWTATMKHTGDTLGFPATGKTSRSKVRASVASTMVKSSKDGTTWTSLTSPTSSEKPPSPRHRLCPGRHLSLVSSTTQHSVIDQSVRILSL